MVSKPECVGLAGRLFGHRFKAFLIHSEPTISLEHFKGSALDFAAILDRSSRKSYAVVCARCGAPRPAEILQRKPGLTPRPRTDP